MRETSDFQTGGILLLVATLITSAMAVAVLSPMLSSHSHPHVTLAVAPESITSSVPPQSRESLSHPDSLQAQNRLRGLQDLSGGLASGTYDPDEMRRRSEARKVAERSASPAQRVAATQRVVVSDPKVPSSQMSAAVDSGHDIRPETFPNGSVYVPVTIHVDGSLMNSQLEAMAQRVETALKETHLSSPVHNAAVADRSAKRKNHASRRSLDATDPSSQPAVADARIQKIEDGLDRIHATVQAWHSETNARLSMLTKSAAQARLEVEIQQAELQALRSHTLELHQTRPRFAEAPSDTYRDYHRGGPSAEWTESVGRAFVDDAADEEEVPMPRQSAALPTELENSGETHPPVELPAASQESVDQHQVPTLDPQPSVRTSSPASNDHQPGESLQIPPAPEASQAGRSVPPGGFVMLPPDSRRSPDLQIDLNQTERVVPPKDAQPLPPEQMEFPEPETNEPVSSNPTEPTTLKPMPVPQASRSGQVPEPSSPLKPIPDHVPGPAVADADKEDEADVTVRDRFLTPPPVGYQHVYRFQLKSDGVHDYVAPADGPVCPRCGRVHRTALERESCGENISDMMTLGMSEEASPDRDSRSDLTPGNAQSGRSEAMTARPAIDFPSSPHKITQVSGQTTGRPASGSLTSAVGKTVSKNVLPQPPAGSRPPSPRSQPSGMLLRAGSTVRDLFR
ncbi:MAG: hypothetical protein R3C49_25625 [Planctomycetaceae bacterium]